MMQKQNTTVWDANSYSQNSELQYQASKKFVSSYTFVGDETVLDIGCGHGRLTKEIAERVPRGNIIGFDSSVSMINYAKTHNTRPNLKFIMMDAQEFSFPDKFDVIISTFCIQWVQNKKLLFHKIAEHLKENGQTLLIMPFQHEAIAKTRINLMQQANWKDYFQNYQDLHQAVTDSHYADYGKEAGLTNIQYQVETTTVQFENVSKFTSFLKNITVCLAQLPSESLRNDFMDELVKQYLVHHPVVKDNSCSISYSYAQFRSKGFNKK